MWFGWTRLFWRKEGTFPKFGMHVKKKSLGRLLFRGRIT
jgi:hypothetical protein